MSIFVTMIFLLFTLWQNVPHNFFASMAGLKFVNLSHIILPQLHYIFCTMCRATSNILSIQGLIVSMFIYMNHVCVGFTSGNIQSTDFFLSFLVANNHCSIGNLVCCSLECHLLFFGGMTSVHCWGQLARMDYGQLVEIGSLTQHDFREDHQ